MQHRIAKRFTSLFIVLLALSLIVGFVIRSGTPASAHSATASHASVADVVAKKHKHAHFRVSPKREDLSVDETTGDIPTDAGCIVTATIDCLALGDADVTLIFDGAPGNGVFSVVDSFPVPTSASEGQPCELIGLGAPEEGLGPVFMVLTDFHGNRSVTIHIGDCVPGRYEFIATELFSPFATMEAHVTLT